MGKYLTSYSDSHELVKLKKGLLLVEEVIRTYSIGVISHVGFSCALAISKAEELKLHVSPFCPAHHFFVKLIEALHGLYEGKKVSEEARQHLDAINGYFALERHSLIRRQTSSTQPSGV